MGLQRKKGVPTGRCTVCAHPQRGRIDYLLIATAGELGGGRKSLSQKFGLSEAALYRHRNNHIPESFVQAVKVGPLESEERLRKLAAETGGSVLQRYDGLYGAHLQRWLTAYEAGNDLAMIQHGRLMSEMLAKIGLLTRELMPAGTHIENNVFLTADFAAFQQRAIRVLRKHPAVLEDWLREFAPPAAPKLIEAAND